MAASLSSRTLAIILGASKFPNAPKLASRSAFYNSASEFTNYLSSSQSGMDIPRHNILWLFDNSSSPPDQLMAISAFLDRSDRNARSSEDTPLNLIIYYVGHGLFSRGDQAYCLATSYTTESHEGTTSIRASDLADVVKERASFLRRYLLLDCCFAASIYTVLQSGPLTAARLQLQAEFPKRGTAVLCSSSAYHASLAPHGLSNTMFSSALMQALQQGTASAGPMLSLSEIGYLVKENLRRSFPDDWVRPEIHSPDQREGDIAGVPLFPNAAYALRETEAPIQEENASATLTRAPGLGAGVEPGLSQVATNQLAPTLEEEKVSAPKKRTRVLKLPKIHFMLLLCGLLLVVGIAGTYYRRTHNASVQGRTEIPPQPTITAHPAAPGQSQTTPGQPGPGIERTAVIPSVSSATAEELEARGNRLNALSPPQSKAALAAYSQACGLRMAHSCFMVGVIKGNDPRSSKAEIQSYLAKGCALGDAHSCFKTVGDKYSGPLSTVRNLSASDMDSLEKSCDGQYGLACTVLADIYDKQLSSADPRPLAYAHTACDLKSESGCASLGNFYFYGKHTPVDLPKAKAAWVLACNGGIKYACGWVKERFN